jgi:hypothetical protein
MVAFETKRSHGDFFLRTVSAFAKVVSFVLVLLWGRFCVSIAVVAMEIGMFREILGLGYTVAAGGRIPRVAHNRMVFLHIVHLSVLQQVGACPV